MGYFDRSMLKPEGSIMGGVATVGAVYGIYQLNLGSMAQIHMTDANHPAAETARKKAGWQSFILVSGLTLVTKDFRIGSLGYSTIIAMELSYRHGIMVHPGNMQMVPPGNSAFEPQQENQLPDQDAEQTYATSY